MGMLPFGDPHLTTLQQWINGLIMFICATIQRAALTNTRITLAVCRAWLVVTRDTQTHEIFNVVTARDYVKKRAKA